MSNRNIERLFNVIVKNTLTINATLDYSRVTQAITRLGDMIADTETDENLWYMGESSYIGLPELVTGAYWHYTEWHGGQWSPEYAALCALGRVYSPGMESADDENEMYMALAEMAGGE